MQQRCSIHVQNSTTATVTQAHSQSRVHSPKAARLGVVDGPSKPTDYLRHFDLRPKCPSRHYFHYLQN